MASSLFERRLAKLPEAARKLIKQDPRVRFGNPYTANAAVSTWVFADMYKAGDSLAELAREFGATHEEISAALMFEGVALREGLSHG